MAQCAGYHLQQGNGWNSAPDAIYNRKMDGTVRLILFTTENRRFKTLPSPLAHPVPRYLTNHTVP